jgi:hypothetical protein
MDVLTTDYSVNEEGSFFLFHYVLNLLIKLKWVRNSMLGHGLELLDSRQPLIFTVMTLLTLRNVGNFVLV